MKYITDTLGVKISRKNWEDSNKLPYFLIDEYNFELVGLDNCNCVFIKPKKDVAVINTVKKHLIAIQKTCKYPVVFEMDKITRQKRKSFIENKIPFVVPNKQLYLPFMGVSLQESFDSEPSTMLSLKNLLPSAQMILFAFIYEKCKPMYLNEAARKFNLTSMSVLRAARQLAEFGLINIETEGRMKLICSNSAPMELFEKAKPYFINPIRKTVYVDKDQIDSSMFRSGLSALSVYGMLNSPQPEVYGSIGQIKNASYSKTLIDVEKQCILEFWKYDTTKLSDSNLADVLSLTLCFADNADDRVQIEIEKLLNSKEWD